VESEVDPDETQLGKPLFKFFKASLAQ